MPTTLAGEGVFNAARMLRVASDLPFLSSVAGNAEEKFTNLEIQRTCESPGTGQMVEGSMLDKYYNSIIKDCPKLDMLTEMLKTHDKENLLILSRFPERDRCRSY